MICTHEPPRVVPTFRAGSWAVHPSYPAGGPGWTVTHVPSGRLAAEARDEAAARRFVAALKRAGLTNAGAGVAFSSSKWAADFPPVARVYRAWKAREEKRAGGRP